LAFQIVAVLLQVLSFPRRRNPMFVVLSFPRGRESHDNPYAFTWDSRLRGNDRVRQFEIYSRQIYFHTNFYVSVCHIDYFT
jgi:hypothetical protein